MPGAIADGPPGREAAWAWTAYDDTAAPVMNPGWTHSEDTYIAIGDPKGLHDLAEADNNTDPATGQRGELGLPSDELGKTIVLPVVIFAADIPLLRATAAQWRHAFRDRFHEGTMGLTPHAAYSDYAWFFKAKVLDLTAQGDYHRARGRRLQFDQGYSLSLRMLDPRFYIAGDPEEISGASGATVVATNEGRADTDPYFTITVPGGTPDVHLQNLSVPTSAGTADLWLRDVPAGELVVDFRSRSLLLDGVVADGYFDSAATDWWDEIIPGLNPGANSIKVTGGAWTMSFRHAST